MWLVNTGTATPMVRATSPTKYVTSARTAGEANELVREEIPDHAFFDLLGRFSSNDDELLSTAQLSAACAAKVEQTQRII
jgi:hypothetical protein